jgi:hypothetical protein
MIEHAGKVGCVMGEAHEASLSLQGNALLMVQGVGDEFHGFFGRGVDQLTLRSRSGF